MSSHTLFQNLLARAMFDPDGMQKIDCFRSERMMVGINCFMAGQAQASHVHEDADKFYLVLRGKARVTVGSETNDVEPGGLVWVPAGEPHAVTEALEESVIVVGLAPGK